MPTFWKQDIKKRINITTADKWFSYFIRLRDADENGYIQCCTCRSFRFWKYADCGHMVKRGQPMTRFNQMNCNAQCKPCNKKKDGEQGKHVLYVEQKYGEGTSKMLFDLGDIRGQKVHDQYTLKLISDEYRLKAKALAKEKGLEIKS